MLRGVFVVVFPHGCGFVLLVPWETFHFKCSKARATSPDCWTFFSDPERWGGPGRKDKKGDETAVVFVGLK